jgi:rubrerythrin
VLHPSGCGGTYLFVKAAIGLHFSQNGIIPMTMNFQDSAASRRGLLASGGKLVLSAAALSVLGGNVALAKGKKGASAQDTAILNVALGLEHEAIGAYQLGAESGLLSKDVLAVAVAFQSHHKAHRDALTSTIRQLGGTPVATKTNGEYAEALGAAGLRSQADVLALAARLEKGAANAYLGVIPSFGDQGLAQVAGRLAADEAMHWTALVSALGQALPGEALSFGA